MSPNAGGGSFAGSQPMSIEYSGEHGVQINIGDLTPYLTYASVCTHASPRVSLITIHPVKGQFHENFVLRF